MPSPEPPLESTQLSQSGQIDTSKNQPSPHYESPASPVIPVYQQLHSTVPSSDQPSQQTLPSDDDPSQQTLPSDDPSQETLPSHDDPSQETLPSDDDPSQETLPSDDDPSQETESLPSDDDPSQPSSHNNSSEESSDDDEEFPLDNSFDYDIEDGNDYFGIPLQQPASRPMINFPGDVEVEDDYEIGWEWLERDTGPMIAPYSGFRQFLLDPTQNKPEDFFNALFESNMYTRIAEETNRYANARINNAEGKEQIFFLYSEIHKMTNEQAIIKYCQFYIVYKENNPYFYILR